MKNLKIKKTLLAKEFEQLVNELKVSGLTINENVEEKINKNELIVTIFSRKKDNKCVS